MFKYLFLLIFFTGCVNVTANEPAICSSQQVKFPGTVLSTGVLIQLPTETTNINFNQSNLLSNLSIDTGMISGSNGMNLSFINELKLTLTNPNTMESLNVLDFMQNPNNPVNEISFSNNNNLIQYFDSNQGVNVSFSITASPPQNDWSLSLDLCLNATVNKTLSL